MSVVSAMKAFATPSERDAFVVRTLNRSQGTLRHPVPRSWVQDTPVPTALRSPGVTGTRSTQETSEVFVKGFSHWVTRSRILG